MEYLKEFFFDNIFFLKIKSLSILSNLINEFNNAFFSLLLKRIPAFPLSRISVGPFGQLLEIINKLQKAASIITNPGSSHKDDKTKRSELFITKNIFYTSFQLYIF